MKNYINEAFSITANLISSDRPSMKNKFINGRPSGIIIQDTYNNPLFPIDKPRLDTSKPSIELIKHQFQAKYSSAKLKNLPWHFLIEIIDGEYVSYNTRPIDKRFPFTTKEAVEFVKPPLFADSPDIFEKQKIEIRDCIHIAIVGDTDTDIYTTALYDLIGRNCVVPFLRLSRKSAVYKSNIFFMNIGKKFKSSLLEQYLKK